MSQPVHSVTLAIPPEAADHVHGAVHAPVTVVEYADFECPSCQTAAGTPELLIGRFPGRVRFIYRHFPVEDAHPHAVLAAEASESAAAQGRFWKMHDLLFSHQTHLKDGDLRHYAAEAGLDLVRFDADLRDHIYLQRVREQKAGGVRSHIRATPTFFVNGVVQDVSFGMQGLHDAVSAAVEPPRETP